MTKDLIKKLILIWTVVMLVNNISIAIRTDPTIEFYWLIFFFIAVDIFICWTAYKMLKGKRWGLITLIIYFGLRAISIYTDDFSFYIKSGLNIEILIAKTIGISLTSLIVLILLIREFNKAPETSSDIELINSTD